jgi:23S rRNA (adenine2503-C2)-methyltransferase
MERAVHLSGLTRAELESFVEESGEPKYRARQIFHALHNRRLRSFDEMTDLPKDFRARLASRATASTLKVETRYEAADGTRRYLLKTRDICPSRPSSFPKSGATPSASPRSRAVRYSAASV